MMTIYVEWFRNSVGAEYTRRKLMKLFEWFRNSVGAEYTGRKLMKLFGKPLYDYYVTVLTLISVSNVKGTLMRK